MWVGWYLRNKPAKYGTRVFYNETLLPPRMNERINIFRIVLIVYT